MAKKYIKKHNRLGGTYIAELNTKNGNLIVKRGTGEYSAKLILKPDIQYELFCLLYKIFHDRIE